MVPRAKKELSPKQVEIVKMIADGLTSKEIGRILGIATKTVEWHRSTAMIKTGSNSLAHLVRYAVRAGLIEP